MLNYTDITDIVILFLILMETPSSLYNYDLLMSKEPSSSCLTTVADSLQFPAVPVHSCSCSGRVAFDYLRCHGRSTDPDFLCYTHGLRVFPFPVSAPPELMVVITGFPSGHVLCRQQNMRNPLTAFLNSASNDKSSF